MKYKLSKIYKSDRGSTPRGVEPLNLVGLSGFTLIELILYIALVALFVTGAVFFSWDIIYGREKSQAQQSVEQNARAALARITYEIRRAQDINSVSASSIELENGASDTTISLSSGTIQITTSGAGPYDLTSNQVNVSALTFTEISSSNENTKGINISLTIEQSQSGASSQFTATTTVNDTSELKTQFNDSRGFLMDASGATLASANKRIEDTTIENSLSSNITITHMTVSWTGAAGQLTQIRIDGTNVFNSTADSGDEVDITDVTLTGGAAALDVNRIVFSDDMSSAEVNIQYKFSDSSSTEVIIDFS